MTKVTDSLARRHPTPPAPAGGGAGSPCATGTPSPESPAPDDSLGQLLQAAAGLARAGGSRQDVYDEVAARNAREWRLPWSAWSDPLRDRLDALGLPPARSPRPPKPPRVEWRPPRPRERRGRREDVLDEVRRELAAELPEVVDYLVDRALARRGRRRCAP
jgi:hypothetical protein